MSLECDSNKKLFTIYSKHYVGQPEHQKAVLYSTSDINMGYRIAKH